jgi:GNAT superfamily N-acetyltransferase
LQRATCRSRFSSLNHAKSNSCSRRPEAIFPARTKPLPPLDVFIKAAFIEGSFVAPNAWQRATGRLPGHEQTICALGFGVAPTLDRIYIDDLLVNDAYRSAGYGSALLLAVAKAASSDWMLPITPLHEIFASKGFWSAMRAGHVPGLIVTQGLRDTEMDAEALRWRVNQG